MNISKRSFGLILLYYAICLGEGGGHSTKFYAGRLHPGVQPLTLLYTIFDKKRYPFHIPSTDGPLCSKCDPTSCKPPSIQNKKIG